jgi:ferritin
MISRRLEEVINKQINAEFYSAYLYLSMAAYFENQNLSGFSNWMRIQFQEEQAHAMAMFNYLIERGGEVSLDSIATPKVKFGNVVEVFEDTLAHEQHVTSLINDILGVCQEEKDYAAASFYNWFAKEQVEEEANANQILFQLKMINGEGHGILMLDRELATRMFVQPVIA